MQQKTCAFASSDASPDPALARPFQHLAPNNNCQTACRDSETTNPASQFRYLSATDRLVVVHVILYRYDVRTAYSQTRAREKSRHKSFLACSRCKRTHLSQCRKLDNSGRKLSHCFRWTPSISEKLLIRPFWGPLRVVTKFSLRYSGQRIFLTWKDSPWSATITLAKYEVWPDACCSHITRATVSTALLLPPWIPSICTGMQTRYRGTDEDRSKSGRKLNSEREKK